MVSYATGSQKIRVNNSAFSDKMPEEGESFLKVMDDLEKKIMPGVLHWKHPNFFAYFGLGNNYPSALAEMFSTVTGTQGFSWVNMTFLKLMSEFSMKTHLQAACPAVTELETVMLDWFAKALALPDFFLSKFSNPNSKAGACIQGSASDAIFAAVCAAKQHAIKKLKGDDEFTHESAYLPMLVCYSSKEAHSCVEKAAKMNLVKFRAVPGDEHDSMRGDTLRRMVQQDIAKGLHPFMVVATSGTTAQAAFDNLMEIGEVCQVHDIWLHIDGAYGGSAFILPERRFLMNGIDYAHSINVNPNKLMTVAFDCTCLWVKDVVDFTEAFVIDPE